MNITKLTGNKCNMSCSYCFDRRDKSKLKAESFDVGALLETIGSLNQECSIHLVGGEPFLSPNIIEFISEATHLGHTINLDTNFTVPLDRLASDSALKYVNLNASLHLKELKRTGLVKNFMHNFDLLKDKGLGDLNVHAVAYPDLTAYDIQGYRNYYTEQRGVPFLFSHFSGVYLGKRYPQGYTPEEISRFGIGTIVKSLSEFRQDSKEGLRCSAGMDHIFIDTENRVYPCSGIFFSEPSRLRQDARKDKNYLGKFKVNSLKLRTEMLKCPVGYCPCPGFTKKEKRK